MVFDSNILQLTEKQYVSVQKSGFQHSAAFKFDDDYGSIERPNLNLSFRTRVACSKSFEIKSIALFPFKRQCSKV